MALVLQACAHGQPEPLRVVLDGLVLRTDRDPLTNLEAYDPPTLFHLALEEERKGKVAVARRIYLRLLEEFPESSFWLASRFNLGLSFEGTEEWQQATEHYLAIAVSSLPKVEADRRVWLDAHFRLAVCTSKSGDWWRAVAVFEYVLGEEWISPVQRLEALVGKGIALHEADDATGAEIVFAKALRHFQEASRVERFDDRGLAAEAAFRMGEITRNRYESVKLAFPQEILMQRLEEKCELLLAAQSRYLRAIRYGDAHTVAAAGLCIGSLYESLHDMIVGMEAPRELSDAQVSVYEEEVRQRVRVLVAKALSAYERSLEVGRRASTAQAWVARLEAAVDRLQSVYLGTAASPETTFENRL
ncbi:MAG: hypothetical protein A2289_14275 [Deltaproteobacteria bacterium RIFOXYA12_FULL_58_15]|nr:MAG: hypothetical protein A2289_14275 [Deltaproteobacteria bacterium RIFOXYA12_FULL_58_15]OGR14447.1 MAG: hypothetical protein A2341_20605 [Deltaproteobacteria bacterium RIFOXYB12_FULL_58_9]